MRGRLAVNGARTTAVAIACSSLSNLPVWVLTGLAPSIGASLGFGEVGLGVAIAAFFGASALSAFAAGTAVDLMGWRRGMVLAAVLIGMSLAGMGLAPSWPLMIAALVVGAVGFAFAQPSSNVALAETVTMARQGMAFGLKQASLPLTTLVVGLSVPLFLGEGGWRWAFACSAGLALLFVVLVVILGKRPPRGDRRRASDVLRRRSRPMPAPVRPPRHRPQPPLLMLAAGAGLGSTATATIGGFLVVFGVSTGLSPSDAGRLLAVGSIVCLISRLVTGWVADRRGRGHLRVVGLMMLGGSTGFVLLAIGVPWTVVAGTALAFGLGWAWNGLFAFAVVHNHRDYPAMATGVVQTAMNTGSATGPLAFGVALSLTSYTAAWIGVAVLLAAGALLILHGRRMLARAAAG